MPNITDWLMAIANIVVAVGVLFVAYQVLLAKRALNQGKTSLKQAAESIEIARRDLEADHERSRRENSANLVLQWSKSIEVETTFARKLVEKLTREETEKLYDQEPFSVSESYKNLVLGCLDSAKHNEVNIENGKIFLTDKQSAHIDWLITTYLNLLESVFLHWLHGVADEEILKEEYRYLVNPDADIYILHNYRTAKEGTDHFPAIRAFAKLLKDEHENKNDHRGQVV